MGGKYMDESMAYLQQVVSKHFAHSSGVVACLRASFCADLISCLVLLAMGLPGIPPLSRFNELQKFSSLRLNSSGSKTKHCNQELKIYFYTYHLYRQPQTINSQKFVYHNGVVSSCINQSSAYIIVCHPTVLHQQLRKVATGVVNIKGNPGKVK